MGNKNTDQNDWRGFGYKNSDKFVIYGGGTTDYHNINQSIFPIKTNIFEKSKVHCISIHIDTEVIQKQINQVFGQMENELKILHLEQ